MASFGTMTATHSDQTASAVAVNYFVTVEELTAHNAATSQKQIVAHSPLVSMMTPLIPYTPFVLVAFLFIVAFGILIINRVHVLKNMMAVLILALMVVSIPMMLSYINRGSRQTANAGPDEIPRNVRVVPDTQSSVIIFWHTDAAHTGVVRLGPAPYDAKAARVYIADDRSESTAHTVHVGGLTAGKPYGFEILSGTTWYDNNGAYIQFMMH